MTNVIKQIVKDGEYGTQTVKMVVRSNERGPQGEQGEPGEAATIQAGQAYAVNPDATPAVMNTGTSTNAVFDFYIPKGTKGDTGPRGKDGAIQYTAGTGIKIEDNVISATGGGGGGGGGDGVWGQITGDIEDQTDLQNELAGKENKLVNGGGLTFTYRADSTTIEANIWPRDFFTNHLVSTEGSGTHIVLSDVLPTKFSQMWLTGNMSQDGTPTPSTPVSIDVGTGTQTVTFYNSVGAVMRTANVRLGAIKLVDVGAARDRINKTYGLNSKWQMTQGVKSYTFTGNETWVTNAEGTNSWDFVLDGYFGTTDRYKEVASEFATAVSYNDRASGDATNTCVCYVDNATSTFTLRNTNLTTLAQVQAATTGRTIYYACTPTYTDITDADLLYDLNNLASIKAEVGTTVVKITATSPSYPMQMYLTAYRFSTYSMGYAIGAATNDVQADWAETISNSPAYIKNKPAIPSYSNFVGTDGVTDGTAGLVPAPATTDAGKFLKADGTWDTAGGGSSVTVVQTTGTSTTDVMSQNATTSMIFGDPGTNNKIVIGTGASVSSQSYNMAIGINASGNGTQSTAIGHTAKARPNGTALGYNAQAGTTNSQTNTTAIGQSAYGGGDHCTAVGDKTNTINSYSTAIGASARARSERSVAIGASAEVDNSPAMAYSVALGANSKATRAGEVNVGTGTPGISTVGFNSSAYRVIGGVYDGQDLHDAATVAQGNTLATAAPDTSTVGVLGQLWTDTTNMHTYQCTAISGSTYTWTQRW